MQNYVNYLNKGTVSVLNIFKLTVFRQRFSLYKRLQRASRNLIRVLNFFKFYIAALLWKTLTFAAKF